MKKILYIAASTVIVMSIYAQGQSTDKGYYVGLGYQTGSWGGDADFLDQSQGGYLSFGSSVLPWLAVEARLGGTTSSADGESVDLSTEELQSLLDMIFPGETVPSGMTATAKEEFTLNAINADLILKPMYTIEQFSVYGIVGVSFLFYDMETEVSATATYLGETYTESVSDNETDSEVGFILGGGVAYDFGNFGINAEVSTYQYGDFDITPLVSIGGTYNF